jgi:hypothetical protein
MIGVAPPSMVVVVAPLLVVLFLSPPPDLLYLPLGSVGIRAIVPATVTCTLRIGAARHPDACLAIDLPWPLFFLFCRPGTNTPFFSTLRDPPTRLPLPHNAPFCFRCIRHPRRVCRAACSAALTQLALAHVPRRKLTRPPPLDAFAFPHSADHLAQPPTAPSWRINKPWQSRQWPPP